jgi:catechol 2,3-dioxygenase-like lactoylglutathione lyase family enzyme
MATATALGLDHIVLVVTDVERTLRWYSDYAGLDGVRIDEWRRGEVPFPSLRIDEGTIIDVVQGEVGDTRGRLDHLCFVVTPADLTALSEHPALEVVDQGDRFGARGIAQSIYVRDPDDLMVEFRSYPDER